MNIFFSAPTESPSAALTYSTRKTYRGVSFELNARRIDKTLINFLWSNGPIINFLDLRFSNIDDDKVMRFAPTLQRMDNLNSMTLFQNRIGDAGATKIMDELYRGKKNIESISFFENCITDVGAHAIAAYIPHFRRLKHINLNSNRIGKMGVQALQNARVHFLPGQLEVWVDNQDVVAQPIQLKRQHGFYNKRHDKDDE